MVPSPCIVDAIEALTWTLGPMLMRDGATLGWAGALNSVSATPTAPAYRITGG